MNNIKHSDLVIDSENPFAACKLDRKQYADVLTAIVSNYADGFVLAINNEWGTGKTTFVKMWKQQLLNQGFETLYFNAWENDFESSPLVAILSELKTLTGRKDKATFKSLVKKGAVLTRNILPAVIKAVADRYIDNVTLLQGFEDAAKAATEILEKEVEGYATRKKSLIEFRAELEKYLQKTKSDKPVIFIIDELDRCKPNYAVEVLEQMKHFFAVKGIVFVLAIDKVQLGHAMRGVYGSEQLNADEYLRRFIDVEYSIPQPDSKQFTRYLFEFFNFDDFLNSPEKRKYVGASHDRESFISLANVLFEKAKPTLRQQEKIFSHARIALKSFAFNSYLFPEIFLFLVYLRIVDNQLYRKIEGKSLSLQELSDEYFNIFGGNDLEEYGLNSLLWMGAQLDSLYNNYRFGRRRTPLVTRKSDGKFDTPLVISKLDSSEGKKNYIECVESISQDSNKAHVSLDHLLKRINLIEPLIS